MKVTIDEAKKRDLSITREDFAKYGKNIKLYKGVEEWFLNAEKSSEEVSL